MTSVRKCFGLCYSLNMRIPEAEASRWAQALLTAAGMRAADATTSANIFIRASRRELGHHDLHDLPGRLQLLYSGSLTAAPQFSVLRDEAALHIFDGGGGLGELCCAHATMKAIERAQQFGIGLCSVRHSNHFLAGYPYAQMGAEAGCLLIAYSNTDPTMVGPGGKTAVIGNNPVGFGAPGDSGGAPANPGNASKSTAPANPDTATNPFLLDTCVAYSSIGNLFSLQRQNQPIPPHWALNAAGEAATTPQEALEGWRLKAIGGHKGYGLALMHEVLTGVLSGGETTTDIQSPGGLNSHSQTVIAIRTESSFPANLQKLQQNIKQAGLRLPGSHSLKNEKKSRKEGIFLRDTTANELISWSKKLGVSTP